MGRDSARPDVGWNGFESDGPSLIDSLVSVIPCWSCSHGVARRILAAGTLSPFVVQEGWVVLWDDQPTPRPVGWAANGNLLGYGIDAGHVVPSRLRAVAATDTTILVVGRKRDTAETLRTTLEDHVGRPWLEQNAAYYAETAREIDDELGKYGSAPGRRARALGSARVKLLRGVVKPDPLSRERFAEAIGVEASTAARQAPAWKEDLLRFGSPSRLAFRAPPRRRQR